MDVFNGIKICVNPHIRAVPKLQLRSDFTACSDAMRNHMNNWLIQRFGTYIPTYVIGGETVYVHPKNLAILRASVKGGAA